MRLILLRHAIAEEENPEFPGEDFRRRLTPEGRGKLRRVVRALARTQPAPQALFSSPLVRARQTAQVAGRMLDLPLQVAPELAPLGAAFAWLCERPEEHLMLVGHEPDLSWLAARFLGLDRPVIEFKKAGLVALEGQPGAGGRILWALTPRWLL